MSTFTAVGPRLDLLGPRPCRPRHSLLETEGVVVDTDGGRWLNGVNLLGYPETGYIDTGETTVERPALWEPCSDGTFRVKAEGLERPQALFDPFVAYLPVTCSTLGIADGELAEMAEAALDASLSFAVERALADGGLTNTNPYLGDGNLDLLGGGAVSPGIALSYLEDAIGSTGRCGIIHATPATIAALQAFPLGDAGDERLVTANGTRVVSGDGYIGNRPEGEPVLGATEAYMYATGPVEVRLGPSSIPNLRTALDREINEVTFRAERPFLVTWDTALQAGVLVDWST